MNCAVTTIRKHSDSAELLARRCAQILQAPYIERCGMGIEAMKRRYNIDTIVIATQTHPIVSTPVGEYFFHLSMAELRINKILNGDNDHMISAMNLKKNQSVLDCTLGMGTDAIVASFIVGSQGKVVGLESSAIISLITSWGLQHFSNSDVSPEILAALRSISVRRSDALSYLKTMADNSFDIVYFDPMFRHPVANSITLKPLRELANKEPLNKEILAEACRVAAQRVIIKEMNKSAEFNRLGITHVMGGKYSSVQYGVLDTGGTSWTK